MTAAVDFVVGALGEAAGAPYRLSLDTPGATMRLTAMRAIYVAYTRDLRLHYIGKVDRACSSTAGRLGEHLRASVRKRTARRWLYVVPVDGNAAAAMLLEVERAAIRAFSPPGNVQHATT